MKEVGAPGLVEEHKKKKKENIEEGGEWSWTPYLLPRETSLRKWLLPPGDGRKNLGLQKINSRERFYPFADRFQILIPQLSIRDLNV